MNHEESSSSPSRGPEAPNGLGPWYLAFLPPIVLLAVQIMLNARNVNHDAAMYLHCGRLLLRGMQPYVDFADLNPPLIMYLSAIPAFLEQLASIHIIPAFHLVVMALVLYSAWCSSRLLIRSNLGFRASEAAAAGLAIMLYSSLLLWTGTSDWGQREHLFILLYAPLFFCRWIRWEGGDQGQWLPVLIGFLAGVGACLKPHFVILGFAVEGFYSLRYRRWRPFIEPESIALVIAGAIYALHFPFLPEAVREAYFGYLVPLIRSGYRTFDGPLRDILMRPGILAGVIGGIAGGLTGWRARGPRASMAAAFGIGSAVALLLYLHQRKGWSYHLIPIHVLGLGGWLLAVSHDLSDSTFASKRGKARIAAWCLLALIVGLDAYFWAARDKRPVSPSRATLLEIIHIQTEPEDSIMMISTSVGEVYPLLLLADRLPGSRYLWTFPLPLIYASEEDGEGGSFPYRSRDALGPSELRFVNELAEDLVRRRPRLVMIDAYGTLQACPAGFKLPEYLASLDFLSGEMAGYQYWNNIFGWRTYIRTDAPAPQTAAGENK